MYQVPPQQGGPDGNGVQDDLQTRCKPSIQPSQKNSVQNPKSHRGKCAHLTKCSSAAGCKPQP